MEKHSQPIIQIPFISILHAQSVMDCSRSFIYKLIDEGKLRPKYIGKKPYLMIENILEIMTEKPLEV